MLNTFVQLSVSVNDPLNYKPNPNNLVPKVSGGRYERDIFMFCDYRSRKVMEVL